MEYLKLLVFREYYNQNFYLIIIMSNIASLGLGCFALEQISCQNIELFIY